MTNQFPFHQDMPHVPRCPRCEGLLTRTFVDHVDSSDFAAPGVPLYLQQCLNCGERLDPRILLNRQAPARQLLRNVWSLGKKTPLSVGLSSRTNHSHNRET